MRYDPKTDAGYATWERAVEAQRDAEFQRDLAAIRDLPETTEEGTA
jgi:hypothetical protein